MIGETIGNFQIVSQLGAGGMGDVFLAEQMQIHTKVAIKLLHANISTDRSQVERFFNEAVAVSKIKHAGTVRISDVGFTSTGRAYLVMEFLEGETLSARIEKLGRLPLADVADIGRQIASVLAATHAEGIVHRDLKPDNIYLIRDSEMARGERVKILDFGIAKLANTNLTGSANSMGTPTYMAPEQWNHSGRVDWRADAYSLGCVAFEMCCGRPPFVAMSIGEACAMHLNDPPPSARSLVPDLPPALDALLMRMLAKAPDDRPASMAEIAAGFSAFADSPTGSLYAVPVAPPTSAHVATGAALAQTQPTGPGSHAALPQATAIGEASPKRRRGALLALGGVLLAGGAATAVVLATRGHEPAKPPSHPPAHRDAGATAPADAMAVIAVADAGSAADSIPPMPNPFIDIPAPPHPIALGLDSDAAPDSDRGFRPGRKIVSPATPYAIQQHEVTWSELEPYLAAHGQTVVFPPWAQDPAQRAHLPATNVSWQLAHDYCVSLRGELPSDEEWEYAARGSERRPSSWGGARLDRFATHTLVGAAGAPAEVMKSEQDKTPPYSHGPLFDMSGNVQEWTEGLWRADKPGADEAWVEDGDTTFRALRGLPLHGDPKTKVPEVPSAYREPACATGECNGKLVPPLDAVGFRCVQNAHSATRTPQTTTGPVKPRVDAGVIAPVDAAPPPPIDAPPPPPVDAAVAECTLESCQESGMAGECCARKFPKKPPADLPEVPPQAEANAAVASLIPQVQECAQQNNAHGKHMISLHVTPDGRVTGTVIAANPGFKACVARAASALRFKPSKKGATLTSSLSVGPAPPR